MAFKTLDLTESYIELPIGTKTYRIDSPDALTGLQVQQIQALAMAAKNGRELSGKDAKLLRLNDDEERDFYERILGDAFHAMLADKIPWEKFKDVAATVMVWITANAEAAEKFWNEQVIAGPKAKNRKTRRASGNGTKKQGSTGGTTNRTK